MDSVEQARRSLHQVLGEIDWADHSNTPAARYRIDLGPPQEPVSDLVIGIDAATRMLLFLANFAPAVADANREGVMRYLNEANWNLMLGNFEMNDESGAVRYRSTLPFGRGELDPVAIRGAILGAMQVVEAHAGAIAAAIAGSGALSWSFQEGRLHG